MIRHVSTFNECWTYSSYCNCWVAASDGLIITLEQLAKHVPDGSSRAKIGQGLDRIARQMRKLQGIKTPTLHKDHPQHNQENTKMDFTIGLTPIEPTHDPCAEEQEEPLHTSEVLAHYTELISWIEDQGVFEITRQRVSGTNR